jgi:hypothetical protein
MPFLDEQSVETILNRKPGQAVGNVHVDTFKLVMKRYTWWVFGYVVIQVAFLYATFHWDLDGRFPFGFFMIAVMAYSGIESVLEQIFFKEFAQSVGFTYVGSGSLDTVKGKLFGLGNNAQIYNLITGTVQNFNVRLFAYSFDIGTGKNKTTFKYSVFEIVFPEAAMPEMGVNGKKGLMHIDCPVPKFDEKLSLEGDFNEDFTVRIQKGRQVDALQVLTPDVMEQLMQKGKNMNFDLIDNGVYMYELKALTDTKRLKEFFDASMALALVFKPNVETMKE